VNILGTLFLLVFLPLVAWGQTPRGIALVLSGGGARGIAQIGAIRALERQGIAPDFVVGTSMGAIVGGLYCAGYTTNELDSIMSTIDWDAVLSLGDDTRREVLDFYQKIDDDRSLLTLRFRGTDLVVPTAIGGSARFAGVLQELLWRAPFNTITNFDSLRFTFRAVATDLVSGRYHAIDHGNLATALRASATFPLRYAPVPYNNKMLVDGGLVANIPMEAAEALSPAATIVVNTVSNLMPAYKLNSPWSVADQALTAAMQQRDSMHLSRASVVISPELAGVGTFDFAEATSLVDRGERAVVLQKKLLARVLTSTRAADTVNAEPVVYTEGIPNIVLKVVIEGDQALRTGRSVSEAISDASGRSWSKLFVKIFSANLLRALHADGHDFASIRDIQYSFEERTIRVRVDAGVLVGVAIDPIRPIPRDIVLREITSVIGERLDVVRLSASLERLRAAEHFDDIDIVVEQVSSGGVRLVVGGIDRGSTVVRVGARIDNERNTQGGLTISNRDPLNLGILAIGRIAGGQRNGILELGFDVPRIAGTEWTSSIKAYTSFRNIYTYGLAPTHTTTRPERTRNGEFSEDRYGVRFGAGRQVERAGIVLAEFRYERQRWRNVQQPNNPAYQTLGTVRGHVRWDDRDRPQLARSGRMINVSFESTVLPLSDGLNFSRLILQYRGNVSVGSFVIEPSLNIGAADRTLPLPELFSNGGQDMFFGMREDEERGRQIVVGQLDVRLRSPVDVFFETWIGLRYDIGRVWANPENIRIADMQHGLGATISIDTPLGPVALSVGRRFSFLDNPPRVALGPYLAYFGIGLRL